MAIFIDFSFILLPTAFITIYISASSGASFLLSGDLLTSLNNSWIFAVIFFTLLISYNLINKIFFHSTLAKRICGLALVDERTGQKAPNHAVIKRSVIKSLIFIGLLAASGLLAFYMWYGSVALLKTVAGNTDSIWGMFWTARGTTGIPRLAYILAISTPLIYFILHYKLLIDYSHGRGLQDVMAGTRVVYVQKGWSRKHILTLIAVICVFYFLLFLFIV